MPVAERAGGLRAMVRCARWLAANHLGYIDFKLENMVSVKGVPRCVDLVENVGDQRRAGPCVPPSPPHIKASLFQ